MSLESDEWDGRTILMAKMVPPNTRVLEFGAGRMVLQRYLPEGCTYIPADLVERKPGMLVCDLNAAKLPNLPLCDVAFFSGVLEYVFNIRKVIDCLPASLTRIVASYAAVDIDKERGRVDRIRHGWVNHYTRREFEALFAQCGFQCLQRGAWKTHTLFLFVREPSLHGAVNGSEESRASGVTAERREALVLRSEPQR